MSSLFDQYWANSISASIVDRGQSGYLRRTSYKPVRHTCGHFEARRMGFDVNPQLGYAEAGNECSQCAPMGRPVQPSYPDLAAVRAVCQDKNADLASKRA